MTLTKNKRKADSIRRCLTKKWWTRSAASHFIETWNYTGPHPELPRKPQRGALKTKETKAGKKQQESWETSLSFSVWVHTLSRKCWSRIIPKEWKLLTASSESMQRVTTVVSGRSVKCNAIFAVWIFAVFCVVDLFSRVDTSHFHYLGTPR